MQEPSHVRAISLVLALSVVIGGWFLFEYSDMPAPSLPVAKPPDIATMPPPDASRTSRETATATPATRDLSITYKCEKNGRISYSDQPCGSGSKVLAVTSAEREAPRPNGELKRLKNTVAAMEASRLEREKQYAVAAQRTAASTSHTDQLKAARCKQIDRAIAAKDAELRQPHTAQEGDYLTGERKKLSDERFSLGC